MGAHPHAAASPGAAAAAPASSLGRFVALYALLYAGFGVASPFLPRFYAERGLSPAEIGVVLGLGTAVRLVSGPFAGRLADLLLAVRAVLAACVLAAAATALPLLAVHGFGPLLAASLVLAAALAPTTTLADALGLDAATPRHPRRRGFEYGWVRGAASVAFIVGSLVAGQVLPHTSLATVVWMQSALLAAAAGAVCFVPPLDAPPEEETAAERQPLGGVAELLGVPAFRRVVVVAALVLGSHALHDGFAMLRWSAAGIAPGGASVLWSESVAAEVVVFFAVGPTLLARLGPGGAMALAAVAGIVRWVVAARTTAVPALALIQPLHGLTFALLHLACMRTLAVVVPPHLAATAQSLYGLGAAGATAALTLASGALYARFGAGAFLVMASLCAVALPLTHGAAPGAAASLRARGAGVGAVEGEQDARVLGADIQAPRIDEHPPPV